MNRFLTKVLFTLSALFALAFTQASGQTITIGSVDAGPYAPGSTVAVPVHINYAGNCIPTTNTFRLFFSNASGVFPSTTTFTVNGSYITFMNFKIPAGTPAGTGYKVKITSSSNPGATIVASSAFTITAGTGVLAGISAPNLNGNSGVFGTCNGMGPYEFDFQDNSNPLKSSVTFFNEKTQTIQQTTPVAATGSFIADLTNYTVIVKATSAAGIVGTMAYPLLNNPASNGFAVANSGAACLTNGVANVAFTIPTDNIQDNYPGNIYTIDWGDGSSKSVYTFCDIQASSGNISHPYTTSSCGQPGNAFPVTCQLSNAYCPSLVTAVGSSAKVINIPTNKFTPPVSACTNTPVMIQNNSDPGTDPAQANCVNVNANYTWSVIDKNGLTVAKLLNLKLTQPFVYTFTIAGTYTIQLELQSSASSCGAIPVSHKICVQDSPKPSFNFTNATVCTADNPIIPNNTTVIPPNSCTVPQYQWTVTPSTGVSFNATSATPQFTFTNSGVYQVGLTVTTTSCGPVAAAAQQITVNSSPIVQLSGPYNPCGNNQTLSFSNNDVNSPTYTVLSGTAAVQADTYTWTVTGGAYSFAPGFTANSKYPSIIFNDFGDYIITVVQKNNCGIVSKTQNITFQQAPTIDAGTYASICATDLIQLAGLVKPDMSQIVSLTWTGGTGTYTPNANTLTATYKPSAAEISAGKVTLILEATTSIAMPCNKIDSRTTITITPTDVVNSSANPPSICSNTNFKYTATSIDAAATFTWIAQQVPGTAAATGFTASGTGAVINDKLVNTDPAASTNAVVAYTITPYNSLGCPGKPFTVNATVTPLPIITAKPANPSVCSNEEAGITLTSSVTGTKYTWTSTAPANVSGNSNNTTATGATSIGDILINKGSTPAVVSYIVTPVNSTGCAGAPVPVSVTVQPLPVTANPGSDQPLCNANTFTLQGNSPAPFTGKWTVTPSAGVAFTDDTSPTSTVTGLVAGTTYSFTWTITSAPGCFSANSVNINVLKPTVGGTTSTLDLTTVCSGDNNGKITLSGQVGNIPNWEFSTDNGTTWAPVSPVNNGISLQFLNLTQTTAYRAIVKNGTCDPLFSSSTTITVNPPSVQASAGPPVIPPLCSATIYTMQANDPGAYQGTWEQQLGPGLGPQAAIADKHDPHTVITGLIPGNIYDFRWTIAAAAPCSTTYDDAIINDLADVIPSATPVSKTICGTQAVQFTNTSNNQNGAKFLWDFGDGETSTDPSPIHTFLEDPKGKAKPYTVTLSVVNNCNLRNAFPITITVNPGSPQPVIFPEKLNGCSPFTVVVDNNTIGDNTSYEFDLFDPVKNSVVQTIIKTDKTAASFDPISVPSPKTYLVYMTATGTCGTKKTDNFPIVISPPTVTPAMYVKDNNVTGCGTLSTTFVNYSNGGSSFAYIIFDETQTTVLQTIPASLGDFPYTFSSPGTYYVDVTASNDCTVNSPSAKTKITVYPPPQPGFTPKGDCNNDVTFTNTTADNGSTPASSLSYAWNFGDGSPIDYNYVPQPHHYDYTKSPFYVTLTVTNTITNCPAVAKQTVNINAPLIAAFTEQPGSVIAIPDYTFQFVDQSTGNPTGWQWDFGDGQTSTLQNPSHTYKYGSAGKHKVTLIVSNTTCPPSPANNEVEITGIPGQLYLPNAFMPDGSNQVLRIFIAKGAGIKTWLLQIFNNYGQLMWQTTKLDGNGSPVEGWDGTFKGAPAPQGAYTWQASATFINGSEWKGMSYQSSLPKRTGTVNLIR